jgi:hypothetical protein
VAIDLGAVAQRLYEGVMAPLAMGGELRPGHGIGARAALALGRERVPADPELAGRVQAARVRNARRLAPLDRLDAPTEAEWALCAAVHDLLQAANPTFDAPLRRAAATRILSLAVQTIDRVPPPATVRDALSRHTWLARVLDVARTDTTVSWWVGSRPFVGFEPPPRVQSWPDLRRVQVVATPRPLVELAPLAFDRTMLIEAAARLLARTPLTEIATCTRAAPAFVWGPASLALIATHAGRTLALRALARLPSLAVDAALGRATREIALRRPPAAIGPALVLLAERALADAQSRAPGPGHPQARTGPTRIGELPPASQPDVAFARALGAALARKRLEADAEWPVAERRRLSAVLEPAARSTAAREAMATVQVRSGEPARA